MNRLTILTKSGQTATVQCTCGTIKTVNINNVKSGKTKSCGCLKREVIANLGKRICGSKSKISKLKEADIPVIREMIKSGKSQQRVAIRFGVSKSIIKGINNGSRWASV